MRLGQTSFVYFLSKVGVSVIGFLSTLYFARVLGADILGKYYLFLSLIAWVKLAGEMGIGGALVKRLSEDKDQGDYLISGAVIMSILTVLLIVIISVLDKQIESYIGTPEISNYLAFLIVIAIFYSYAGAGVKGHHLVHIWAGLTTVRTTIRIVVQLSVVSLGFGLFGLVIGWATGTGVAMIMGVLILLRSLRESNVSLQMPSKQRIRDLLSYAKYSWLGGVRGQTFNWIDIAILGLFVKPSLIGVYSIAWNIASFLSIFGASIRESLFPKMSELSAEDDPQRISHLLEDSLTFTGLIVLPGLVGGLLLGDRILRLYGDEFTAGTTVLGLLILAILIYDYQLQFTNTLNAADRPDLSFRVNAIFITANVILNIIFVSLLGWVGAAVATVLSAISGLIITYLYLDTLIEFSIPFSEIIRQLISSGVMGFAVYILLWIESSYRLFSNNVVTVVSIVVVGAGVYFCSLFLISDKFRNVVKDNSPIYLPEL